LRLFLRKITSTIRGQTVSNEILKEIRTEISKKANALPEIKIIKED